MEAAVLDSNPSNYEFKSELSNCCFGIGIVYAAKYVPTQQFVAIKKFQMDKAKEESNLIRVSDVIISHLPMNKIIEMFPLNIWNFAGGNFDNAPI